MPTPCGWFPRDISFRRITPTRQPGLHLQRIRLLFRHKLQGAPRQPLFLLFLPPPVLHPQGWACLLYPAGREHQCCRLWVDLPRLVLPPLPPRCPPYRGQPVRALLHRCQAFPVPLLLRHPCQHCQVIRQHRHWLQCLPRIPVYPLCLAPSPHRLPPRLPLLFPAGRWGDRQAPRRPQGYPPCLSPVALLPLRALSRRRHPWEPQQPL